jgi:4-hydroxy-tetrahydrodipicolinate synthase
MSTQASIPGVFSPVLTPFDAAYRPALGRYVKHCRWLREQSVGLAIFGTNSEANSLALSEKRSLLDALLEAGVEPSALMPGTGACALPDAIELTRHAVRSGSMGVLVLPPFYYKGVVDDRLRMYLYHIPPVSQVPLSLDLIDRLLDRYPGQVAGVKDSGGDWNNTAAMIERFAPRGFKVYAGSEAFLLQTLRAGGVGCITATGNVNPGPIVALQQRWQEADADARQAGLNATRNVFGKFPMIPAMKAAIAWKSGDPAWATVRPPLVELNAEQRTALQAALDENGFDMPGAQTLADN